MIREAAVFSEFCHRGQKRKYEDQWGIRRDYIEHCARVAGYLVINSRRFGFQGISKEVVAAAWLHDVSEDTGVPISYLEILFGKKVATLVDELTNRSKEHKGLPRAERKQMDREYLATVSPEAKMIKMVDRWDNLRDMWGAPPDFKLLYCEESKVLAHVIGDANKALYKQLLAEIEIVKGSVELTSAH